jgi:hypothetical protein
MRIALVLGAALVAHVAVAKADCTPQHNQARALRETLASVGQTTDEYRALMLKKIQSVEAAAAACERATADARRADAARAEARKREMEANDRKQEEDRFAVDELRSHDDFLRVAWSAFECSYEKERDTLAGNPFATPEQRESLKRADLMLARIRATMKHGKLAPLSCRMDDVAKLAFCVADASAAVACTQSEMALRLRAEKEIIAAVQLTAAPAPLTPAAQHAKREEDDMVIMQPEF